ncbi:MAG: glutamine synthetase family protein [Ilumatobacter sp.]|uniref:glutamine synthetase family protein n=1 Tax=Ilumatobacter sp. TaxID=1967498 RepID=UPI00263168B1|nr:glutamine synthetase family protein [Ilumatobacter sp.]MDJ0770156.1 glutamine synthetase family protein [Ilumatobacter sp.]
MTMTVDDLRSAVASGDIATVIVAFTDVYGRLLGKRFDAAFFCESIEDGTHACDYLLTVDMEMEPTAGYRFASWDQGYGDVHLAPDLTTLRRAAWTDRTAIVLCDVDTDAHEPVAVAPRSILRRQMQRLAERGLVARAASELEFFIFDDTYREAHAKGYADLQSAGWYIEDYHLLQGSRVEPFIGAARASLAASGIPVETSKGEWGRGQHEINIRYADVLEMADRHAIMKHAMKELADAMGLSVTFMAKPTSEEAGSSNHIHLSLWDAEADTNAFDAAGSESDLFRWFLAGWVRYVPDLMACYAPTVNSYKRYLDASWAPTRIAWSRDNRTAGFRVVGSGPGLRIENRIPGADCNPYLAYAASIAAGLAGIEQQLEPPPAVEGDAYGATGLEHVPRTLDEAAANFRASDLARSAFGDDVVDHYAHFHDVEVAACRAAVTDWERARYFERI